jgi:ankyrin repeat protein
VRLLLERGADPTIADANGSTPLMAACDQGRLAVVRLLLKHPCAIATFINHRDIDGQTALWKACRNGRQGVVRALLESGADPTITTKFGTTPMAIAKQHPDPDLDDGISPEGRRECVEALEVRSCLPSPWLSTWLFCPAG